MPSLVGTGMCIRDSCCMGVGENGHIAFNDPPVADFEDERLVKIVELDVACRMQQVNEGHFPDLEAVPKYALTLTVPALCSAKKVVCVAPESRKAMMSCSGIPQSPNPPTATVMSLWVRPSRALSGVGNNLRIMA